MKHIRYKGLPHESAKKAYDGGYYIEAIQNLHGFLENQAQLFLYLIGCFHFNAEGEDKVGNISDTLSFVTILKVLLVINQITKDEYDMFEKFNIVRNHIVHKYYKDPYGKEYLGLPKKQYDEAFQYALNNTYFFTEKGEAFFTKKGQDARKE